METGICETNQRLNQRRTVADSKYLYGNKACEPMRNPALHHITNQGWSMDGEEMSIIGTLRQSKLITQQINYSHKITHIHQ